MILHLDCIAGASGDMILAALIDAGADLETIQKQISSLPIEGISIEAEPVLKNGVRALSIHVTGESIPPSFEAIRNLVTGAPISDFVRKTSVTTLERLAAAEATVHGIAMDDVHFHELSGADTLVDIVGVAVALELLEVEEVSASPVPTGWGSIQSHHGTLPIPAPAALELMKGAPIYGLDLEAELLTPTGAAILTSLANQFGVMPSMVVDKIGYGAGAKDLDLPNILRAIVGFGTVHDHSGVEEVVIEANVDDMNPEFFEYVSERLFAAGANDVWVTPVIGKRGRPANLISVMVPPPLENMMRDILIQETSTIGTRATRVEKWMLERTWEEVIVAGRPIRMKIASSGGKIVNIAPEYSDCAEVARTAGIPIKEVWKRAIEGRSGREGS